MLGMAWPIIRLLPGRLVISLWAFGYMGELTPYLPFELVDDVLEQTRTGPGLAGQCPCFRDIRPGQAQVLRYSV